MRRFVLAGALLIAAGCTKSGARAVYAPDAAAKPNAQEWNEEIAVVRQRLKQLEVPAGAVVREGDTIVVRLADADPSTRMQADAVLARELKLRLVGVNASGALDPALGELQPRIMSAEANSSNDGRWTADVKMSPESARAFEELTGKLIGRQLAIVLDGKELMRPVVQEKIPGGILQISLGGTLVGKEAQKNAKDLANDLRGVNLPFPLVPTK